MFLLIEQEREREWSIEWPRPTLAARVWLRVGRVESCSAANKASRRELAGKDAACGRDPGSHSRETTLLSVPTDMWTEGWGTASETNASFTLNCHWLRRGSSVGRSPLGNTEEKHYRENNAITFMLLFLSQMLLQSAELENITFEQQILFWRKLRRKQGKCFILQLVWTVKEKIGCITVFKFSF